jgi:hypothetical protein
MVLTVAIAVFEDLAGFVWFVTAIAQEDRDVADMFGDPIVDPVRLLAPIGGLGRDFVGQCLNARRYGHLSGGQLAVGGRDRGKIGKGRDEIVRLGVPRRQGCGSPTGGRGLLKRKVWVTLSSASLTSWLTPRTSV